MTDYKRFAIYYAPPNGAFADWADAWLGWSARKGREYARHNFDWASLNAVPFDLPVPVQDARKYGFHGTIRAPFRPAEGMDTGALIAALNTLAAGLQPVRCDGLALTNLDGFLALTPWGDTGPLHDLAGAVVRASNPWRSPLTAAEMARRRPEHLTQHQRALLNEWGYPFVMDEFQFHLTLTDRLPPDLAAPMMAWLQGELAPLLPRPFEVDHLCLFAEDAQGMFHLLHRAPLLGLSAGHGAAGLGAAGLGAAG